MHCVYNYESTAEFKHTMKNKYYIHRKATKIHFSGMAWFAPQEKKLAQAGINLFKSLCTETKAYKHLPFEDYNDVTILDLSYLKQLCEQSELYG